MKIEIKPSTVTVNNPNHTANAPTRVIQAEGFCFDLPNGMGASGHQGVIGTCGITTKAHFAG